MRKAPRTPLNRSSAALSDFVKVKNRNRRLNDSYRAVLEDLDGVAGLDSA
jgi:hypothetical protein